MHHERLPRRSPEVKETNEHLIELAGSLQVIINELPRRGIELEPHQQKALQNIGEALLRGDTEGYVEAATGSGKTLLISLITEAAVRIGKRVLLLAPTTQIADQLIGEDGETGLGFFTELPIADCVKRHFGGRRGNAISPVVASTYSGYLYETRAIAQNRGRLGHFDVILGDECHESLGTETSTALHRYGRGSVKLGFSATPDYAEDRKSEEIYGKALYELPLTDAIDAGITAPIRPLAYTTGTSIETLDSNRRDFTEKELAPLIDNPERNGVALQLAQDFVADGRQGIIACVPGSENQHAKLMAQLLSQMKANGKPIVAADIGSHLSSEEQARRRKLYDEGKIDILTFTRALERGWDSDRASFALNLSPTTSPVRIIQLLGRILRENPDGRESIFVDFIDELANGNKQQYTAFHALRLEEIDNERVLGWRTSSGKPRARSTTPPSLSLRPELLSHLMGMQGTLVAEAIVGRRKRTAVNPLFAQWERRLAKEGMPAELPFNLALSPKLNARYEKTAAILQAENGTPPTNDEIVDYLKRRIPEYEQKLLREYGQRALVAMKAFDNLPDDTHESVEEVVARLNLKHVLDQVLDTLSEREAGIVSLRDGEGKNLDEVGRVYGVTRERVRQIHSKAMNKLRHPSRKEQLEDLVVETRNGTEKKTDAPASFPYAFLTEDELPTIDPEDPRPYVRRLREAGRQRAEAWLHSQRQRIDSDAQLAKELAKADDRPLHRYKYARELRAEWLQTQAAIAQLETVRSKMSGRHFSEQAQATSVAVRQRITTLRRHQEFIEWHLVAFGQPGTLDT